MKLFAVYLVSAVLAFGLFAGIQFYLQPGEREPGGATVLAVAPKAKAKRLRFPADLAPTAQAQAVEAAASFVPGPNPHKLLVLRPDGSLHPWHDDLEDSWQALTVEGTELVLVVGKQDKVSVQHITYPNGAPPITRFRFDLEVSVVEAKTGKVLANQRFSSVPRPINRMETWATTALGRPVPLPIVLRWLSRLTRLGFPDERDPPAIVTQAEI